MVEACIFCDFKFKSGNDGSAIMLHFFKHHPDNLLWLPSAQTFAEDVIKSYLKDLCENCLCHKDLPKETLK